jgi:hypothetical protein
MTTPFPQPTLGARQDRFFGKYRGRVSGNQDPEGRGRLQVEVPEVRGDGVLEWALPASPYAGDGVGFFALPPVGANVWVEYEGGNLRVPIWSGCFWLRGEIDAADAVPEVVFLRTAQASIRIDSARGEVKVELQGTSITLTASEARIEAPQVTLTANGASIQLTPAGMDALQGALRVM